MCKKTTNRTASQQDLIGIQPNTAGSGSNGGSGGSQAARFILGDNVPQYTFISAVPLHDEDTATTDRFLSSAVRFHTFHGLKPARFKSFVELVKKIKSLTPSPQKINRLRIVTHAFSAGISTPLCDDDPGKFLDKVDLKQFLISNEKWMTHRFGNRHLIQTSNNNTAISVLRHIKDSGAHNAVLAPFNFNSGLSNVSDPLKNVVLGALNDQIIDQNFVKRLDDKDPPGSHALTSAQRTLLKKAFSLIQTQNKLDAVSSPVTAVMVDQLESSVRTFTLQDYQISFTNGIELNGDTFLLMSNAQKALDGNFRANLDAVRSKFEADSWIDIRGCLLGEDVEFMKMIGQLLGKIDKLPGVSAPNVFQAFPEIGFQVGDSAVLNGLLNNGEAIDVEGVSVSINYKASIQSWLDAIECTDTYFTSWKSLFAGTATNLCVLKWKAELKTLKLKEGLQVGWDSFDFPKTINRLKEICGVSAGQEPTASQINSMKSFVETKLSAHGQFLTDGITGGNMQQVYDDLNAFAAELNANITQPAQPLDVEKVNTFRNGLIAFIDSNKLPKVKGLLQKAANIVNDANGKLQLLFHFGVPVLSLAKTEDAEEPDVRITHILALPQHRHTALRILLRALWQESLPTPNSVGAAMLDNESDHGLHRQVSGLSKLGSEFKMTICPMPKFMDSIVKTK